MKTRRSSILRGAIAIAALLAFSPSSSAIIVGGGAPAPAASEPDAAPDGTDQAKIQAGLAVYKAAGCRGCHGWAGTGEREGPNPQGPSLRTTMLDFEALREVVACGRPGTEMPYFWRDAYRRTSTECFGVTAADLGDQVPTKANARFKTEEIDDLAYYLAYQLKGKGDITLEECEFYYGEGDSRCAPYSAH